MFLLLILKVCDDRHSELIPCLDRNLIYQMRLKLDLSLMEHYERHCPLPERRYNCLIPPPAGYKVRMCELNINKGCSFLIFVCLVLCRSLSSGQKAEMKYGKQTYLILTLRMRSLTRIGWL